MASSMKAEHLIDPQVIIAGTGTVVYMIYKRFEPVGIVPSATLLLLVPSLVLRYVYDQFSNLPVAFASVFGGYWLTLLTLTTSYRLSPFHSLASFPGPLICKITKIQLAYRVMKGDISFYHLELHRKYGDVVRIGPNELSISHEDAVIPILRDSLKGPCKPKRFCVHCNTTRLMLNTPRYLDFTTRRDGHIVQLDGQYDNPQEYAERRRPWTKGMSTAAIKDYEELLKGVLKDLLTALERMQGEPVDIAKYMIYTAFDFMGEMSFSKSFNCIKNGSDTTGIIDAIGVGVYEVAWMSQIPWIMPFLVAFAKLFGAGSWKTLQAIGRQTVRDRVMQGSGKRDLFHYLSDVETSKFPLPVVAADGMLAIVAGSDTTATAVSHVLYFLARHPECMERLRKEIEDEYPGSTDPLLDFAKQAEMPYLNACINEAMRLLPPVMTGLQRTLASGKMIGPHFIPEGTHACVSHFSMQRDPRYFYPLPKRFWPDRWLTQDTFTLPTGTGSTITKDQLIHNKNVFVPFSIGTRSCAGKSIAVVEMRAAVCALVQKFDIEKAEGYDLDSWEKSLRDTFVTASGPLMMVFKPRY